MTSVFHIFDHFMYPLVEIGVDSTPREWVLNDVGRCDFSMGVNEPKFAEANMEFGNLVLIEHVPTPGGGRLPYWVGIIMPRQTWNAGVVNCTAFSAETILTKRPMPWVSVQGTPRQLFLKILEYVALVDANIQIQPGVVEDASIILTDDFRGSAYEHIVNIVKRSGMTWNITGSISQSGKLELYANLTAASGIDTGLVLTNLNSELHSPIMVVDGLPENVVSGYSQASTAKARYGRLAVNDEALAKYGYFGVNKTFTGIHDPSGTQIAAQIHANTFGHPIKKMNRTALNFGRTFDYLDRGNLVEIDEPGVGFRPGGGIGIQAKARIISMAYSDPNDKVVMNTEILQ